MSTNTNAEYGADQIQILEGLKQSGNVLVCISEVLLCGGFTILSMRL